MTTLQQEIISIICQQWEKEILQRTFTECGGLVLKKITRVLVELFGDEGRKNVDLKKIEFIAMLLSLPKDVVDIESIFSMSDVPIEEEEKQQLLKLRICDCLLDNVDHSSIYIYIYI